MNICVTLVGVCRPSFTQVKHNIESNILYFNTTYPKHKFTYILLTYKNASQDELKEFCSSIGIKCIFIDNITSFIFPVKIQFPNGYRLFYSMNRIMDEIPKNTYDCILRVRLDSEIVHFQIYDSIDPNTYYSFKQSSNGVVDNIGYASYNIMKKVWRHENCLLKGTGGEAVLYSAIQKNNIRIKPFHFHYKLYQSNSETFDGVTQWSKRSREWIYDGKDFILRDIDT